VFNAADDARLLAMVDARASSGTPLRRIELLAEALRIVQERHGGSRRIGKKWLRRWVLRMQAAGELSRARSGRTLEPARARAPTTPVINAFFTMLKAVYDQHGITADRLWNVDETDASTADDGRAVAVYRTLRTRHVPRIGGSEKATGGHVTFACFVNAAGRRELPLFILSGQRTISESRFKKHPCSPGDAGIPDGVFLAVTSNPLDGEPGVAGLRTRVAQAHRAAAHTWLAVGAVDGRSRNARAVRVR
jgi:hypothetical protein